MARIARIHQPPRSAMQSGRAGTHQWVLSFPATGQKRLDPLTGWWGSGDTEGTEVVLCFPTRADAVAYATAQGLAFEVEEPPAPRAIKPKVYADNFKFGRATNWTH
ncbi:ETC complex I subunit [Humitalea sp. 24SJ18S-53]|uniref:ETC complex I subunit n=1 Tax=Humitalea sp. 24SJ18S-53 TaxID=3422307 RepID=UPI003D67C784